MNILGISGLDRSMAFKRRHWPGLEEREYRISQGHDSAAALLIDGEIVAAAAEERFTRAKHTGSFPARAINFCLREAGIGIGDIDELAHCFDYRDLEPLYSLDPVSAQLFREVFSHQALLEQVSEAFPAFPHNRVVPVPHHLSHAASAWLASGWPECLVVVLDGMGETESGTVYAAYDGQLDRLAVIPAAHSIGVLYSLVTLHLGFEFNSDEYKVMGLAPYGDPDAFRPFFESAVELADGGQIRIPLLNLNRSRDERENYAASRRFLAEHLGFERSPSAPLLQQHSDIAAALQQCLERVVLHICGHFRQLTGFSQIAMAGGVALNCAVNGSFRRSGLFDEVFIQPASGDDGAALGAALYRASVLGKVANRRIAPPLFGPRPCPSDVDAALAAFEGRIDVRHFPSLDATCEAAAEAIAAGKVIAWYRDRMEFGPRALGNRSILADPGRPDMRDRVNALVKKREAFRPFAPAVAIEEAPHWFEIEPGVELAYMIATVQVRPAFRAGLPAVTHVDGSARVQTVSAKDLPAFHTLLRAVGRATGRSMVLNTSFNVKNQPIVNTPIEAIETFLGTDIDCLFLQDHLVTRRPSSPENADAAH